MAVCDSCSLLLPVATCSCDSELAAQGGPWLLQQGVGFNTQRDLTLEFGGLSKLCLKQALCPCWFVAFVGASLDRFVSQTLTKCYLYISSTWFLLHIQYAEDSGVLVTAF